MDVPNGQGEQTNTFAYDGDNKISTINGSASNVSYDANGNLTKLTVNGKTQQYVYDAANRLITVKDGAGAVIASYTYDGDGQRLTKTVGTETITYHYFGGQLMYETSNKLSGQISTRYTRTPEGKLLSVSIYSTTGNKDYYYHYNAHGDVVAVTDSTGALYRQYAYDPYGNVISVKDGAGVSINMSTDEFNHAYTYAGYRYDKETGLYFLNARYYAAGIGRFLTKDTWKGESTDPQTLNRYSYALGDPINFVDHSGHRPGVSGGPEGLDAYNSVSETPYRPNRQSITSSTPSKAYNIAKKYIAPASRIVTAVGASTALIGSIIAAPGLVPLGFIVGGVGIGLAITLYATGVDTSKLHLAEAVLGAVPLARTVTVGGVAMGRGLSLLSRADIGAGFVKQAGEAIDSVRALRLFDGALGFGIGASSLKW